MYDYPEIIRSSRIPYINKSDPNKITLEECIEAIEFRFAPQIHNDKLLANTLNQVKNKNTKIVEEVSLRLYSLIHKGCS
ncbi:hypothetical protein LRR18_17685, partial [Mangrovimonas sp. AS39]|uniref:hypothetical protein n=1 Tax=Mangrovimonas futianensis TaxID=2895523 RepID=UPI001E40344B